MKKLYFLFIVVLVLSSEISLSQTWTQTLNGIPMWAMSKDRYGNIYAGSSGSVKAIYKTTNEGQNWLTLLSGSPSNFLGLSVDSLGNIFGANVSNGVMKSTDGGNNWVNIPISTFGNKNVQTVVCGKNGVVVVGCNNGGIFRSTDYGVTFPDTSLTGVTIVTLVVDRFNSSIIYAGASSTTGSTGFFISTNSGFSFSGPYNVNTCWGIMQKTPNDLYMVTTSTGTPFTKSTNGGYNWTTVSAQPGSMRGCSLDLAGNIYINGNGGVFKSTNDGLSFTNTGITASGNQIVSHGNKMYAATTGSTTGGVWIYTDTTLTSVTPVSTGIPENFELKQNYPNPFNPVTKIEFSVPVAEFITLKIFDIMGREIRTLVNEKLQPGTYEKSFDGSQLTSGVYFYKIAIGDFVSTKKMLLVR